MGTVGWLLAALLVMTLGRRYSEEFLAWVSIHKLPEGAAAPLPRGGDRADHAGGRGADL